MDETSQPTSGTDSASGGDDIVSKLASIVGGETERKDDEQASSDGQAGEESDAPVEGETKPDTFKVKVGGQEIEVSLDELKAGYQKDADYRQKTAALSEERKAVEAQRSQQDQQVNQARQAINQAAAVLAADIGRYANVDWQSLAIADPAQYVQLQAQLQAKQAEYQRIGQQHQQLSAIEQQRSNEARQMNLADQQQAILAKLEDWKDSDKRAKEISAIKGYLKAEGYADHELDQVDDHRAVLIARKAMLFDALMAKQSGVKAKVQAAPERVERTSTGQRPGDGRTAAMKQLAKTGSVRDAAAAMKAFL